MIAWSRMWIIGNYFTEIRMEGMFCLRDIDLGYYLECFILILRSKFVKNYKSYEKFR